MSAILPFAFPLILVAAGALAASREKDSAQQRESGPISLRGGTVGAIQRDPPRWTTVVAWTMVNPFIASLFPADTGFAWIRAIYMAWWLACAAFTGFLLPRPIRVRT